MANKHDDDGREDGSAKRGFSVNEARHWSSLGRSTLYAAMGDGRLPFTKVGRRTVILRDDLLRLLKGEVGRAEKGAP